jgi:uncharacterized membrane protein YsdA (DUF1294 family)/cold shock CspA family protein
MAGKWTTGVVVSFDDQHGFGFIRSHAYREDVYVHARVVSDGQVLKPGQRVRFDAEGSENGPRALWVKPGRRGLPPDWAGALGAAVVLAVLVLGGRLLLRWTWPSAWLVAINLVTFAAFAWDKRQAVMGERRVPEVVLLALSLVGGTPGALLAMAILRHKTHKGSFQMAFGGVVALQIAALSGWWWISPQRS